MSFSFDGGHYKIDLNGDNVDALREAFSDYVAAVRKVIGRAGRTSSGGAPKRGNSEELAKIREWANANGHDVSSRPGRPRPVRRRALTPLHPTRTAGRPEGWPAVPVRYRVYMSVDADQSSWWQSDDRRPTNANLAKPNITEDHSPLI